MKKIICILFALILIAVMSIPAYAATPKFSVPKLPEIPNISDSIKIELPGNYWETYFRQHPFRLDFSRLDFSGWLK